MNAEEIKQIVEEMTLDELCGQLLCYHISDKWAQERYDEVVKRTQPGGIFFNRTNPETVRHFTEAANRQLKVPVIVAADVENGPGCTLEGEEFLPHPMAWGACDDPELVEKAGRATAEITRRSGIHWTFSPVIDLNMNPDNPVTNIRAVSDSPRQVVKMAGAYLRGLQRDGLMLACCKHFPGDGVDDRNQHFCTTINSLSKEEWMNTYGYVYKEMIRQGAETIMAAHIALPAFDDEKQSEVLGYRPAILSKRLITDLLKGELGFEGCVVSDALTMIGSCSLLDKDKLVVEFIKAGGDMALFAVPEDFDRIKQAVQSGELSLERVKDAARRVLNAKNRVHLLDNSIDEAGIVSEYDIREIADKIGEKSIHIVRNAQGLLPLNLKKGSKILIVNLQRHEIERSQSLFVRYLDTFAEEFKKRGFEVEVLPNNANHMLIREKMQEAACVLVNAKMSVYDYTGGSLRVDWTQIMAFWAGDLFQHPCVVFTSFGDPYKLHDYPYLQTYINAFSSSEASQRAAAKVILGEIEATGKSPVTHRGYFTRQTD